MGRKARPQPRVSVLSVPVRFEIVFERTVSVVEARQVARRVFERLRLDGEGLELPAEFGEARLRCAALGRSAVLVERDEG